MPPTQEFAVTFHYLEFYQGQERKYTHLAWLWASSTEEARRLADAHFKELTENSGTPFNRRLLEVSVEVLAAAKPEVAEPVAAKMASAGHGTVPLMHIVPHKV